jgi:hypothetical protein
MTERSSADYPPLGSPKPTSRVSWRRNVAHQLSDHNANDSRPDALISVKAGSLPLAGVTVGLFGIMDGVEQAEYDEITGRLRGLVVLLDDRLSARDLVFVAEFIDVGELGLALEQMADALCEDEAPVARTERADMLALAERMNLGSRVFRALRFCPERPEQR